MIVYKFVKGSKSTVPAARKDIEVLLHRESTALTVRSMGLNPGPAAPNERRTTVLRILGEIWTN
jgi:hypothetical protein